MKWIALIPCLVIATLLMGCSDPPAVARLIRTADGALDDIQKADAEIQAAFLAQVDDRIATLDQAFLNDMERLERVNHCLMFEEVRDGKTYYDTQRAALENSRRRMQELFRRKQRTLQAARQLLVYADELVVRRRAAWTEAERIVDQTMTILRQEDAMKKETE